MNSSTKVFTCFLAWLALILPMAATPLEAAPLTLKIEYSEGLNQPMLEVFGSPIVDGGLLDPDLTLNGHVEYEGVLGGLTYTLTSGDSFPTQAPLPAGVLGKLLLQSVSVNNDQDTIANMRFTLSSSYSSASSALADASAVIELYGSDSTATLQSWVEDALGNRLDLYAPAFTTSADGVAAAGVGNQVAFGPGAYSLFTELTVVLGSFNAMAMSTGEIVVTQAPGTSVSVPEPTSLFLLGPALVGLATTVRRRSKRRNQNATV
jgi:hypothetical protein